MWSTCTVGKACNTTLWNTFLASDYRFRSPHVTASVLSKSNQGFPRLCLHPSLQTNFCIIDPRTYTVLVSLDLQSENDRWAYLLRQTFRNTNYLSLSNGHKLLRSMVTSSCGCLAYQADMVFVFIFNDRSGLVGILGERIGGSTGLIVATLKNVE